jgi:serine/threonine-protein kinase
MICSLVVCASLAQAMPSWRRYANDRYAVSADAPADWRAQPPPDNDDGQVFLSPDGRAQLIINGGFMMEANAAQALDALARPREGERVVYAKRGARALSLSGTGGDKIFYRRTILTCSDQVWNNIEITYPASEKSAYDPLVTHIANSLRGGEPAGMRCAP